MSYFAYGKHPGTIVAHVALMILGWCFVLPAGMLFTGLFISPLFFVFFFFYCSIQD